MNWTAQALEGVGLITPHWIQDTRGTFAELVREQALSDVLGYSVHFVQENESMSHFGVLRGLHYQRAPYAQAKLIRVVEGTVLDVAVDLRPQSATYGQHVALELSAQSGQQLFIPKGFAHGFAVLSQTARVNYKVDAYYAPAHQGGIKFDCPTLAIDWRLPSQKWQVSKFDADLPALLDLKHDVLAP